MGFPDLKTVQMMLLRCLFVASDVFRNIIQVYCHPAALCKTVTPQPGISLQELRMSFELWGLQFIAQASSSFFKSIVPMPELRKP